MTEGFFFDSVLITLSALLAQPAPITINILKFIYLNKLIIL